MALKFLNDGFFDGNVGIGTDSPDALLHVAGAGSPFLLIQDLDGTDQEASVGHNGGNTTFVSRNNTANGKFTWYGSNGTTFLPRMTLSADGELGIGTTTPEAKLQVSFNGGHTSGIINVGDSSFDIYNPLEANTAEKGSILTFSDNYLDAVGYQRTTRAAIKGGTDTVGNSGNGFLSFYTDSEGANTATERMRIDSAGNVGIGTTDPLTNLHIATAGSTNTQAGISNSGTGGARLYMDAANGDFIGSDYMTIGQNNDLSGSIEMEVGAGPLHIVTGSSNRLTVLQTGKVGIGTTDPTTKLDITETTAETNTLKDVLRLNHITSGTAASGLGAGILFSAERPLNGVNLSRGAIYGVSGPNENDDGDLAFHTRTDTAPDSATAGMNEKMRITHDGAIKFNAYDSTNNTGTPTYLLGTDASGNVVKALSQNGLGFAPAINFIRSGITSTYTMIATVNGDGFSSIIQMSITGTSGSTVLNSLFDISVSHSQDIHVTSQSGDYTEVTLRITSNNNEDFSIEAKHDGPSAVNAEIWIYPKAGESVTPTTVDPGFSGSEYEHIATEGWRFGGEDNDVESSQVIIDDKLGIGITSPTAKLHVKGGDIQTEDTTGSNGVLRIRSTLTGAPAYGYPNVGAGDAVIEGGGTTQRQPGVITLMNDDSSIVANQDLGVIQFVGKDDATNGYASSQIIGTSNNNAGTGNSGGGILKFLTSQGSTISEKMRIAADGKVGIGVTSLTAPLQVAGIAEYTNNTTAKAAGLTAGAFYRTGDDLKVVH